MYKVCMNPQNHYSTNKSYEPQTWSVLGEAVHGPHGRHVDLIYDSLKPQSLSLESCREHCQYVWIFLKSQ
jgi:hypothetical protein